MPEIELLAGWSARRFRQNHGFIGSDTVAADPIILIAVSIGCEHILLRRMYYGNNKILCHRSRR